LTFSPGLILNLSSNNLNKYFTYFSNLITANRQQNRIAAGLKSGITHGAKQPRPIHTLGEAVSAEQRSDSLVQSINRHFLNLRD
jgi:hypothetical protein